MKITHVISDGNVGGAGILLSSLAEGLKDDFEIEIIIPEGSALKKRLPEGVSITELPVASDKSFSVRGTEIFRDYFKRKGTDILHTHASLSARLGGKMAGIPHCISTRHCAHPGASVRKMMPHKRFLYDISTDLTVSTADFATDNLVRSGVRRERIVTIKNGSPDLSKRSYDEGFSLYDALTIPRERRIIGSVARLEAVKGQDLILRSAREVLKFFPDTHFVFVGSGSLENEYRSLSARLGVDKNVSFTGYVENPDAYQRDFYINVNASRGTETSSLATSECMSLSIPSVVSSFGGNREMIKHGVNGMIFNTDNVFSLTSALLDLLEDEELYRRLSLGARRSYEESFSLSRMTKEYKKLYHSLSALYL